MKILWTICKRDQYIAHKLSDTHEMLSCDISLSLLHHTKRRIDILRFSDFLETWYNY